SGLEREDLLPVRREAGDARPVEPLDGLRRPLRWDHHQLLSPVPLAREHPAVRGDVVDEEVAGSAVDEAQRTPLAGRPDRRELRRERRAHEDLVSAGRPGDAEGIVEVLAPDLGPSVPSDDHHPAPAVPWTGMVQEGNSISRGRDSWIADEA